ncbi:Glutamine synthetase leaf isozyme, chloroplastic-like protein [Drosera capensis]
MMERAVATVYAPEANLSPFSSFHALTSSILFSSSSSVTFPKSPVSLYFPFQQQEGGKQWLKSYHPLFNYKQGLQDMQLIKGCSKLRVFTVKSDGSTINKVEKLLNLDTASYTDKAIAEYICPHAILKDPFRGGNNILVICDTYTPAGEPIPTNKRHKAAEIFSNSKVAAEVSWGTGMVQVVTLITDINTFSWGVVNRGFSIRVGHETEKQGKGYLEDRRPASNMDPYVVTSLLAETTILWEPSLGAEALAA